MAQLVAHLHGMEGVGGSNPPSSTDNPHRKSDAGFSFQVTFPESRMSSSRVIGQNVCPVVGQSGVPWYSVGAWNSSQSMPVPYRIGIPVVCHAPSGLRSQASR